MALGQSLRKLANRVFGKNSSNDNARFQYTITDEQKQRALNPPTDNSLVETLHGVKVSDPFRPLEDLDAPETADWATRQNKKFEDFIAGMEASIEETKKFMTDAYDYDSHSLPSRYGDVWFRSLHKANVAQSVKQKSNSAEGPWTTILDPNALSENGTVAVSGWYPSPDGKRVAYFLSGAGSDTQTLHILDTETGTMLDDKLENCRFSGVLWDKDSHSSFQYTYPIADETKRNMTLHHVIGTSFDDDKKIFMTETPNSFVSPHRLHTAKYEWMYEHIGTNPNNGLRYRPFSSTDDFKEILPAQIRQIHICAEFDDGTVLALTTHEAPRKRLVRFDPAHPAPENWQSVIPQHALDLMDGAMIHQGKLYVFYAHDTADAVRIYTPEGKHLADMPLPLQSTAGFARINPEDTNFLLRISSFKTPGDTYTYDTEKNEIHFRAKSPAKYDLNDCIVERLHAPSKDGTLVPMTVIRHPDTVLDGTAAVKLYGYGGFNVSLTPGFDTEILHFVRSGGIYAQANLRGGGEFGDNWYNLGRLAHKQNVFDDFAACAKHLIQGDYTCPERLIINGGSNGGLLTSATMLQHPELFGAVITEVAVTDMFRFHLGTHGSAWISDYGDPGIKEDFNNAARYSPLHNVKLDEKYPPHLIKTADHDDRVLPWHSFKLAATLQAKAHPDSLILMRIEKDAGHGAGKPIQKIIEDHAETFAFIEKAIGAVNQQAYKAEMTKKQGPKKSLFRRMADKFKP